MHALRLLAVLVLACWSLGANAAAFNPNQADCAKILQMWAENPNSVPKHLVDACKEKMTWLAPAAGAMAAAPSTSTTDPCSGPNAAASVLCWGPWASLAPAAGGEPSVLNIPDFPGDCDYGSEISEQCVARLAPLQAVTGVEGCTPGTPCGFATIVDGVTSTGDVESTDFRRFDMATDGSSFSVDPDGVNEIDSVDGMTPIVTPRNDGYENLRSNGRVGDEQSRLVARVVRDDQGQALMGADIWGHGNRETGVAQSGYFAWGVATSQAGMSLLNGNGISTSFSGPMSVNNATNAAITVNYGSQPNWTGTWTNPAWSFGAGGALTGVNLNSNPSQFTSNVQAGSFVQGALVGEPGRQGITHIIDVNLEGQGHIKDVGLLRQIANPQPVIQP